MTLRDLTLRAYERAREAYAKAQARKPNGISRVEHQRLEIALTKAVDALRDAAQIVDGPEPTAVRDRRSKAMTMKTDDVHQAFLSARRKVGTA
jgi:hypothetical protein